LGYVFPVAVAEKGGQFTFSTDRLLHYWQSPDNALNELVRDDPADQETAVRDLYAVLLHTSSTHATQEFGTRPWSTRDYELFPNDILPDGATSGRLIELMRNMLVREYKKDLFIFSALSPAWMHPGDKIEMSDAPTNFGPITAVMTASSDGFDIKFSNRFRELPERIVVPVPWFYQISTAQADGKVLEIEDGKLILQPDVRNVKVNGRIKADTPDMSFEHTVESYEKEYGKRYKEFLRTGAVQP